MLAMAPPPPGSGCAPHLMHGLFSTGVAQSRDLRYRTALQVAEREVRQEIVQLLKSAEENNVHGMGCRSQREALTTGTGGGKGQGRALAASITRHLGIKR